MPNIIHKVGIKSTTKNVYNALSSIDGLSQWWTNDVQGTSHENGEITFTFKTPSNEVIGQMVMKVKTIAPGEKVEWTCLKGPADWIGTTITFDLSQQNEYAIVLFGHRNWKEEGESMAHCSTKWATFLMSLKQLIETGKGKPSPNDIKIDNWN